MKLISGRCEKCQTLKYCLAMEDVERILCDTCILAIVELYEERFEYKSDKKLEVVQ